MAVGLMSETQNVSDRKALKHMVSDHMLAARKPATRIVEARMASDRMASDRMALNHMVSDHMLAARKPAAQMVEALMEADWLAAARIEADRLTTSQMGVDLLASPNSVALVDLGSRSMLVFHQWATHEEDEIKDEDPSRRL